VEDAIAGTDMGQEGVAQTLASVSSLHQSCYVYHVQEGRHLAAEQAVELRQWKGNRGYISQLMTKV
jgi:hypothetical protein